jgi:hypothetical protein
MRKLRFDLNNGTGATLTPNAESFYAQAYLGSSDIVDNFRTLPGVKFEVKIGTVTFGDILQPSTCAFTAPTDQLTAKLMSVCALSSMAQICQFDLEQSFVSLQMAQGSNGDFSVANFMNFYWSEMANSINGSIESLRWQGDISLPPVAPGVPDPLSLCDGYEVQLGADLAVIPYTLMTPNPTFAQMLTNLQQAFALVPANIASRTADLRIYLPTQLVNIYRLGVASGNTNAYITQDLNLTYLGIKIVLCPGMSNDHLVITLKDNLVYLFDGEGDPSDLRAVNLADTVAEPYIRTRANMKIGFNFVNPQDIVYGS